MSRLDKAAFVLIVGLGASWIGISVVLLGLGIQLLVGGCR